MGLPGLDVVLGLAAGTVDILVNGAAAHTIETGDDEACVGALRPSLDAGDDALDAVPARGAIVEFLEPAQLLAASAWQRARPCWPPVRRCACAAWWSARRRGRNRAARPDRSAAPPACMCGCRRVAESQHAASCRAAPRSGGAARTRSVARSAGRRGAGGR